MAMVRLRKKTTLATKTSSRPGPKPLLLTKKALAKHKRRLSCKFCSKTLKPRDQLAKGGKAHLRCFNLDRRVEYSKGKVSSEHAQAHKKLRKAGLAGREINKFLKAKTMRTKGQVSKEKSQFQKKTDGGFQKLTWKFFRRYFLQMGLLERDAEKSMAGSG